MYDIIYAVVDRVKALMSGLHGPVYQEVRQGEAEVRAVFQISKIGRIAGCYVTDGKIVRGHGIRVFRNDQKLHEGKINTLKRFKDDAREVAAGYECGIGIEGFDGVEVGDRLETFSQEEVSAA
jgi:translation initiation factor IF-2